MGNPGLSVSHFTQYIGDTMLGKLFVGALALLVCLSPAIGAPRCPDGANTIKGDYLFNASGSILGSTVSKQEHYSEAGIQSFDGVGVVSGIFSSSAGDSQVAFSGTYTLGANCVGTFTAPIGGVMVKFDIYAEPSGANITYSSSGFSGRYTRM